MHLDPDPYFSEIQRVCSSFQRLISKADLLACSYPYFPLTFSLWRQEKYSEFMQPYVSDLASSSQATLRFHQAVDSNLLQVFMRKCRDAITLCLVDLKSTQNFTNTLNCLKGNHEYQQLLQQYSGAVASQLVMLQALTDLATMPYGLSINHKLETKPAYSAFPVQQSQKSIFKRLYDAHAKTIMLKGVGKVGSDLLSKVAVGLTAMAGGLNLAGLAGGFLMTHLYEELSSFVSETKLVQKLQNEIQRLKYSKVALQERYLVCRRLLKEFLSCKKESEKKMIAANFEEMMKEVFYYDYSHKVLVDQEDEEGSTLRIIELQEEPWEELS